MDRKDVVYTYNVILLSHKKKEIMLFAATQINLDIIILSEISWRKTNIIQYHLYMESKKKRYMTLFIKQK